MDTLPAAHTLIKLIISDPRAQARPTLDKAIVTEYAEAIKAGDPFPAIEVFVDDDDGQLYLGDGFYRLAAHKLARQTKILAVTLPGGLDEAIKHAAGANTAHGVRRDNAAKRRAVAILLDCEAWSDRGDNWIAEAAHVGDGLVAEIRAERGDSGSGKGTSTNGDPPKRLGKDGKRYPAKRGADPTQPAFPAVLSPHELDRKVELIFKLSGQLTRAIGYAERADPERFRALNATMAILSADVDAIRQGPF